MAWLTNRELAAAAGVYLAANLGACSRPPGAATPMNASAVVAPIFKHGEGRGSAGCVVTAPPAFLAEDEALQIIREELTAVGLDPSERRVALPSVIISGKVYRDSYEWVSGKETAEWVDVSEPLVLDLRDPGRRLGIVYISDSNYYRFGGALDQESTVSSWDYPSVAEEVRSRLAEDDQDSCLAVFYDPLTPCKKELDVHTIDPKASREDQRQQVDSIFRRWHESERNAQNESKELLRKQVQDFIQWLKAQGVI
jgi:hypothetical protein